MQHGMNARGQNTKTRTTRAMIPPVVRSSHLQSGIDRQPLVTNMHLRLQAVCMGVSGQKAGAAASTTQYMHASYRHTAGTDH